MKSEIIGYENGRSSSAWVLWPPQIENGEF